MPSAGGIELNRLGRWHTDATSECVQTERHIPVQHSRLTAQADELDGESAAIDIGLNRKAVSEIVTLIALIEREAKLVGSTSRFVTRTAVS